MNYKPKRKENRSRKTLATAQNAKSLTQYRARKATLPKATSPKATPPKSSGLSGFGSALSRAALSIGQNSVKKKKGY